MSRDTSSGLRRSIKIEIGVKFPRKWQKLITRSLKSIMDSKFHLVHDYCEIMTDHYDDFLRRKRERAPWIIKEWTTGEGIFEVDHYIARLPQ
ncbi:MAG: hypothetical protein K2N48_13315 [Muribaculaceae bacterium]|nr:hypothetical protein [Muribaculaceae bacterium]